MRSAMICGVLGLVLLGCSDDDTSKASASTDPSSTGTNPTTAAATDSASTTVASATTGGPTSNTAGSSSAGDSDGTSTGPENTSSVVPFSVSSTAFEEGGLFPTTMHIVGGNVHPQLDWVGAPAGTMSFGVFFRDVTIDFEHSAIWNIPADATGLPEDVEQAAMPSDVPGAVQALHWAQFDDDLLDYLGPPPRYGYGGPGSKSNTYEFIVYALDVADLSGEIDSESDLVAIEAALAAHTIEMTSVSGQAQEP